MAGAAFRPDPEIEKWYKMRETTHLYFRPTTRNVVFGFVALVAVPVGLYHIIDYGNVALYLLNSCSYCFGFKYIDNHTKIMENVNLFMAMYKHLLRLPSAP